MLIPRVFNPFHPDQIILNDFEWFEILHERIHYCAYHNGLMNLEARAYACERNCQTNEEWKGQELGNRRRHICLKILIHAVAQTLST